LLLLFPFSFQKKNSGVDENEKTRTSFSSYFILDVCEFLPRSASNSFALPVWSLKKSKEETKK